MSYIHRVSSKKKAKFILVIKMKKLNRVSEAMRAHV